MKSMLFIGLRLFDDKVMQVFLHNKKEYQWVGIKYLVLGGRYEATEKKDGHLSMSRTPKCLGHCEEEEIKQEWKDADTVAHEFIRQRREIAKARRVVAQNWDVLQPLHDFFTRHRFAEAVVRAIIRGKP